MAAQAPASSSTTPTVLPDRRRSLNERKRTRETISTDSTSTMTAVRVSLTSRYWPALWLTMTMNTSTLAAVGMVQPQDVLARLLLARRPPRGGTAR